MSDIRNRLASLSPEKRDYTLKHAPRHLAKAGKAGELYRCLTNFDFIEAKISAVGVQSLVKDYDLAFNPDIILSDEKGKLFRLIQGALRLSAHILDRDKTQLSGQLWGRLLSFDIPDIQALLEQAKQGKVSPWLRPLTPSLTQPGEPLLRTITGHADSVMALEIVPDTNWLISGSDDRTLKIWDFQTGKELKIFTGHTAAIRSVAATSDGRLIISGSKDTTLKVWNLKTEEEVFTLKGHSDKKGTFFHNSHQSCQCCGSSTKR
ncbi:MAG: WD40 repeat domain-containing protein [Coleofasciculus sp. G3-WIS-01]|uniref:WD40 repeat domain-containing protein n=1 Tax=Coleofasciculus sp. G3-WIS-01 TaxID=3069528 RepID=UPI0033025FDC